MGAPLTPPGTPPPDDGSRTVGAAEALEGQLVGSREVHFQVKRVQPPAALYVTGDDNLYVAVANVQAGLALTLTATMLLPDGRVQASAYNMNPPATGAQTVYLFPLAECFLLNVSIMPASSVRYGAAWIFCCIRRGGIPSGINLQTLMSDYVDAFGGPSWPGSGIRHSTDGQGLLLNLYTASVAAGAGYAFTVPTFARIRLRSIALDLQTSATVANRFVNLTLNDNAGHPVWNDIVEVTQAANLVYWYSWGLKLGTAQSAISYNSAVRSLPDIVLSPSFTVTINVVNIAAADQLQAISLHYEQWFTA